MSRRLMVLVPQHPFDPASGAPRSDRELSEILARAGWPVRFVATTASEAQNQPDPDELHGRLGIQARITPPDAATPTVYRFGHRGVEHALMQMPGVHTREWGPGRRAAYERFLLDEAADFQPELLMTWGSTPMQTRWRGLLRERGVSVVMSMHNHAYAKPRAFAHADAVLSCSDHLTDFYRDELGLVSTPLPPPVLDPPLPDEPPEPGTHAVQMSLSPEKGMSFTLRLIAELAHERPDIPVLGVVGRAKREVLRRRALVIGLDLDAVTNLETVEPMPDPEPLFRRARVMLHPSLWREPSSRVAAESCCRGIPVVCSERGGLPTTAGAAGMVVPIDSGLTPRSPAATRAQVRPWLDAITRLFDDDDHHRTIVRAALHDARARFHPDRQRDAFVSFFMGVPLGGAAALGPTWGPGVRAEGDPVIPPQQ